MNRRLLNLLTVLSLLLGLAGAAVWARSYFVRDVLSIQRGTRATNVFSGIGSYTVFSQVHDVDFGNSWQLDNEPVRLSAASAARALTRFEWSRQPINPRLAPPYYIVVPQWTVPALFSILPAVRVIRRSRRRRAAAPGFPIEVDPDTPPSA